MISKFWWLNFFLFIMIVFSTFYTFMIWQKNIVFPEPKIPEQEEFWPEPVKKTDSAPDQDAYDIIAAKNLFNALRKEHLPPKTVEKPIVIENKPVETKIINKDEIKPFEPEKIAPLEKKDLILYGVIIMEGYKTAFINGQEEEDQDRQIRVREKDHVGNYTIEKILPESIIVMFEKKHYRVLLFKDKTEGEKAPARHKALAAAPEKTRPVNSPKIVDTKNQLIQPPEQMGDNGRQEEDEWMIMDTPFGKKRIRRKK